jgi:hypothetical protein
VARIAGIDVSDPDAYWVVDELLTVGEADAAAAAFAIDRALANGKPVGPLSAAQRQAMADALFYAPVTLEPLRRELARSDRIVGSPGQPVHDSVAGDEIQLA